MSEYLRDSGHNDMRTCDECGGAFYASRGPTDDGDEEEWTCDTCEANAAEIERLKAESNTLATTLRHEVDHRRRLEAELERLKGENEDVRAANARHAQHVVALGEQLAALETEFARLRPSGQVAEDESFLNQCVTHSEPVCSPECSCDAHAALSRLAAKAQGYEAAVADNAALLKRLGDIQAMVFSLRIDGHEGDEETGAHGPDCGRCARDGIEAASADALSDPHPGAALLKERHEREAVAARAFADGRALGHGEAVEWLRDHHCGILKPTAADLSAHLHGVRSGYMKEKP